VLGGIGMIVSLFGSDRMLGCGQLLEKVVHPMGCGRRQKKTENGDNAQGQAAYACGNWFSGFHGLCG
jgi:hypothetical protein